MVLTPHNTSRMYPWRAVAAPGDPGWALIAEVEAAVRSVLSARDRAARVDRVGSDADAPIFADRLFALRHAEALSAATREVRVGPSTVVTPLARDFLKKRGITLRVVAQGEVHRVKHPGEWGFAIEADPRSGVVAALHRLLLEGDWSELGASLDDAARWVADSPHRGALVLTDEASVAVWRACQVSGVRAAGVADPEAVGRAVRRLGVNLLVIEPAGKSISWIRQLSLNFRRAGAPEEVVLEGMEVRRCESPR